jgi:WD40 repeat protein
LVWDLSAHNEIASFKGHHAASVVALNRDGTKLAAVGWRQAKLWEVDTGKELRSFQYHVPVWMGAAFSSDLATLAAGNYQEIDLWDAARGTEKATLSEHRGEVGCMIWSADDKTLIASSYRHEGKDYNKWKGDLKLWDVASGKERATLPGPFGHLVAISPSPHGKTLALLDSPELDAESDLKLVDVDTGGQRVMGAPPGYSFLSLRFTTEGKLLVTGASIDTLRLWEVSRPNVKRPAGSG